MENQTKPREFSSSAVDAIPDADNAGFVSILFPGASGETERERQKPPGCFHDLHLDQIVAAVTNNREEYDLDPFFHIPLHDADVIAFRQEVMRDLEREDLRRCIEEFSGLIRLARRSIAFLEKLNCPPERQCWFLRTVETYCEAIETLAQDLDTAAPESRGLCALRNYLAEYLASESYLHLAADARDVASALHEVRYSFIIAGDTVTVRPFANDIDYTPQVESTFAKFRHAATRDYLSQFDEHTGLNHVETRILERVALLNPETFGALERFLTQHADFADSRIEVFEREVQFYLAYHDLVRVLRRAGLNVCYPRLPEGSKGVECRDTFDLALALKLIAEGTPVICNDISLHGAERLLVVSGPNQGGKTTYARSFGQLHYLASLGCPVPGSEARLAMFDRIFTHFEREEQIADQRGKLEDDLVRIAGIVDAATRDSIVVVNELFSSTTLEDAVLLSRKVMANLSKLDVTGVWVTFLDELATFDDKTVSVVAGVDPSDPAVRTYRLERRPADGVAHALAIAEKYRVTYEWLKHRVRS